MCASAILAFVVIAAAHAAGANPAPPATPLPIPRQELVLVDDRAAVKAQAPAALLQRAVDDIARRTGVTTARVSAQKLDDAAAKALAACGNDKCLADFGKKHGADVVVTLRVEKREGVFVLDVRRVSALASVKSAAEGRLARTDAELATALDDALGVLLPAPAAAPAAPVTPK